MAERLLSPHRTRVYPNAQTGYGQHDVGSVFAMQREGLQRGDADVSTMMALRKLGWTDYDGPAATDARGWIIANSDPNIHGGR